MSTTPIGAASGSEEPKKTLANELKTIMEARISKPSDNTDFSSVLNDQTLHVHSSQTDTIDEIIKARRADHAYSFGDKYLADMMHNTSYSSVWVVCQIARCITGTLAVLGKFHEYCPPGILVTFPFALMRSMLMYIAVNALSITPQDRKEQAIRTAIEGNENYPDNRYGKSEAVYDKNKLFLEDGVEHFIKKKIGNTSTEKSDTNPIFIRTAEEKTGLCSAITSLLTEIKTELPGSENKSWVKKLQKQLDALGSMECTKTDPATAAEPATEAEPTRKAPVGDENDSL